MFTWSYLQVLQMTHIFFYFPLFPFFAPPSQFTTVTDPYQNGLRPTAGTLFSVNPESPPYLPKIYTSVP